MFNFANPAILNVTTDQSALLALKDHVSYDPDHVLTNSWSTSTSVCTWVGVTCGSKHLRVKALNLSYMDLVGTIPPHIGNLSFLVRISFLNNSFHGSMPNELSRLHRLEYLNFGYNEFSGEIPSRIGFLTKLQYLGLHGNNFEGTIPPSLSNATSLQIISLGYNQLSGSIPSSIFNIFGLQIIHLRGNKLTGPMPSILVNMSSLQFVDLSYNMLVGTLPMYIFDHLPNLQFITLSSNQLHGQLPSTLYKCKQLQVLSLSMNNFNGRISPKIGNLTMLTELYLSNNNFEGTIASSSLLKCKDLQLLSLAINNFTGRILPNIGNLTMLTELYLDGNNFEGSIPSEIGNLQNLEYFGIEDNGFAGPIPFKIFNISTIQAIYMGLNKFSGHLPSDMGFYLPKLKELSLYGNKLSGIISSSISNASQLTLLELSKNSLSGIIPEALGNLRLLQWLSLGVNNLTMGSQELNLFSYLSNCKDLRMLSFSFNPLHNFLPNSIGNLSLSLQNLYLSSCHIKGSIPAELGNLGGLIILVLSNNKLEGPIPTTLRRLHMLQLLSLRANKLEGHILPDLCHLKSLYTLSLDRNKLFGHIPTCISNLTSLRHLYLGFNQLTSTIPLNLWSLKYLLEVDLSSNSLSGLLSLKIGDMKVLRILDLSRNQLSGNIPITISGLVDLTSLSFAVNQLEGSIPESFGELLSLEILDLSSNNLSGRIPKSLEALLYLKYLNVSFNNLRGKVPTGGPFVHFGYDSFISNDALCGAPRLQAPPCENDSPKKTKAKVSHLMKYLLPAIGLAMLVVIPSLAYKVCKTKNPRFPVQADLYNLTTWRRISHQELLLATERFNSSNLLGEGSFGSVYKGTLLDGMNIAVKVINLQVEGAFKCFDAECEVLRNARHRNLVKIITICSNVDFKALVLEYMPNENLEKWLYSDDCCLNFLQRLNIMIDVASALEYLHYGYSTVIVHCDLKPSNILLDVDMVAHVADFGMAKLLGDEDSMMQTMTLATLGYMAPEYGLGGVVSARGDVYSYGILVIETFTRKKPTDDMFAGEMSLKRWVNEALPISTIDIVDASLLGNEGYSIALEECISSMMGLALDCCAELPEQRTNMKIILAKLKKIKTKSLRDVEAH
ncbi:probable LRR receptor-like serine/threonine-protein kinase At3g47570 [Juglans microcarpa x Juglans regia]|uniref:probable LRR receptor-like serine/threonine-protein kinase At3g47570 n=1 Tax=Juglans microcarpa x Juglans regia TaxID=2249226 RepID=UPI001B7F4F8D|nr:probable LRR receptor-like serine/threonine-protein kinase At3g47570 [Juglans microcarpa x Juglans regia]